MDTNPVYKKLIETTKWPDATPNHTYYINDKNIMVGYVPNGTDDFRPCNSRLFSTRGRTFKKSVVQELPK